MSIIPSKTPINLVLDGVVEENVEENVATLSGYRLGQGPLEVIRKIVLQNSLYD
jgi:hypothetical protein